MKQFPAGPHLAAVRVVVVRHRLHHPRHRRGVVLEVDAVVELPVVALDHGLAASGQVVGEPEAGGPVGLGVDGRVEYGADALHEVDPHARVDGQPVRGLPGVLGVERRGVVVALEVVAVVVGVVLPLRVARGVVVVVEALVVAVLAVHGAALDLDAELQVVVAEGLGEVRQRGVHLVARAVGVVEVGGASAVRVVGRVVVERIVDQRVEVVVAPPARVLDLGERLGAEDVAPLQAPDRLRRVLVLGLGLGGERPHPARPPTGLVVVVPLEGGGDVVVGARLPGQLGVEARAQLGVLGQGAARVVDLLIALPAQEEEELVLDQRPAQLAGEVEALVDHGGLGERGVGGGALGRDVVAGEVGRGPVDVEEALVPVAARLRHGVHHRAGVGPVLGRGAESAHLHLVHDVEVEEGPGGAGVGVAGVDAVHQQAVAVAAVPAERRPVVDARGVVEQAGRGVRGPDGQVEEQVLRQRVVGGARARVHQGRLAHDVDRLADTPDREGERQVDDPADGDDHVVLSLRTEAGELGGDRVGAGVDPGEAEAALHVGHRRAGGGLPGEGDVHARQDAAPLVPDGAGDGTGDRLGGERERGGQEEERDDQDPSHGVSPHFAGDLTRPLENE